MVYSAPTSINIEERARLDMVSKDDVTLALEFHWCSRSLEDITIIDCCGEFPNVPLLGIRGGITYNPSLAL